MAAAQLLHAAPGASPADSEASDEDRHVVLVVTASNLRQAAALEDELLARRNRGAIPPDWRMFAVPDPSSQRVGSGGATLNALATLADLLSLDGLRVADCLIMMIHSGGDSQRLPSNSVCGKAWCAFPSEGAQGTLDAPLDLVLRHLRRMFAHVRTGLVVACSDMLPAFPGATVDSFDWSRPGVTGLAVPMPKDYGTRHGVFQTVDNFAGVAPDGTGSTAAVKRFHQKATLAQLEASGAVRDDDTVLLDSGIVYFDQDTTNLLVYLSSHPPLLACTFLGPESDVVPLRVELYSDILMALGGGTGLSMDEYLAVDTSDPSAERIAVGRRTLWETLSATPFHTVFVHGSGILHLGTTGEYIAMLTHPSARTFRDENGLRSRAACFVAGGVDDGPQRPVGFTRVDGSDTDDLYRSPYRSGAVAPLDVLPAALDLDSVDDDAASLETVVLNSELLSRGHLGAGCVVEHCSLSGRFSIGCGALASGVRTVPNVLIKPGVAVQEVVVDTSGLGNSAASGQGRHARVITLYGVSDSIKINYAKPGATLCGQPWEDVFRAAGVDAETVWTGVPEAARTLWTAKLFPVFSLPEMETTALGERHIALAQQDAAALDASAALWLQDVASASSEVVARWRSAHRLSLKDVLRHADAALEFSWRAQVRQRVDVAQLRRALLDRLEVPVGHIVRRLAVGSPNVEGRTSMTLTMGQRYALQALDAVAGAAALDVAARALALISELLWSIAGWGDTVADPALGPLTGRSGPARHAAWTPSLEALMACQSLQNDTAAGGAGNSGVRTTVASSRAGDLATRRRAIAALASVRAEWCRSRHFVGRAARHYERASGILVAHSVATASILPPKEVSQPDIGVWICASAPARVDLAGAWSDTPPVTYEAGANAPDAANGGGSVCNVGVLVDGVRSIGARVCRTKALRIVLRQRSKAPPEEDVDARECVLVSLDDFAGFDDPASDGSLVKCALLCAGIVSLKGVHACEAAESSGLAAAGSLEQQLLLSVGGGLEIETWSTLPIGSGLGGSSIVGAVALAALTRAAGRLYDLAALSMMTLRLEQLLTTGGGWQDQVGGLYPGVKIGRCAPGLPLQLYTCAVANGSTRVRIDDALPEGFEEKKPCEPTEVDALVNRHLLLVYTGRARLAKNLLQRVLRGWALRDNVAGVVQQIVANTEALATALVNGDIAEAGRCMSCSWELKKRMAPGAEPPEVTALLETLRGAGKLHGASLCGAGGGGFLALLVKREEGDGGLIESVRSTLEESPRTRDLGWSLHSAVVDSAGLTLSLQ